MILYLIQSFDPQCFKLWGNKVHDLIFLYVKWFPTCATGYLISWQARNCVVYLSITATDRLLACLHEPRLVQIATSSISAVSLWQWFGDIYLVQGFYLLYITPTPTPAYWPHTNLLVLTCERYSVCALFICAFCFIDLSTERVAKYSLAHEFSQKLHFELQRTEIYCWLVMNILNSLVNWVSN